MSGEDKTPPKTLKESIREQLSAKPATQVNAKDEGISSQDNTSETNAGEPLYVSGIDISDIPEQDRPRIKEKLEKKAKLLEDGYQKKYKEIADFKKAQDDLLNAGLTIVEARNVLNEYAEKKRNPVKDTTQKTEAAKTLDKLIKESNDPAQRASLDQLKQIILEETNASALSKKIEDLEAVVQELRGETTTSKRKRVEEHITELKKKYGDELIDKYSENMFDAHLRVGIPMPRLLQAVIPIEEIEEAILSKQKKPITKEKRDAISSPASDVASVSEKVETKGRSYASVLKELMGRR